MLRQGLLSAVAAAALLTAPAAFAQNPPVPPPPSPVPPTPTAPAAPATLADPARAVARAAPVQAGNVIDVLTAQGNFTTLLAALDRAQLTGTLRSRPAISIFAPTDAAFAALPEAERTRLMDPANAEELRNLLLYHVIVADVSSAQIRGARGGVETAARTQVLLDGTGEAMRVDGAMITRADIDASNGAVFAIDKVLNPADSMVAAGDEEAATPADEAAAEEVPVRTPPTLPVESTTPPATTNPAPAEPAAPDIAPVPGAGVTATTRPATGVNAPNGQPAATVTTVQSPPVHNPTDGQVDDEEDPLNPAPTPPDPD